MTEERAQQLTDNVERRIPRAWRGDLRVEQPGELAVSNGRPAGTPYVEISARTKLARMQAMISIGPFAANDPDEWFDCWRKSDGGSGGRRWLFCVYEPSEAPQQPDVFSTS
jgi:hypothetical protein